MILEPALSCRWPVTSRLRFKVAGQDRWSCVRQAGRDRSLLVASSGLVGAATWKRPRSNVATPAWWRCCRTRPGPTPKRSWPRWNFWRSRAARSRVEWRVGGVGFCGDRSHSKEIDDDPRRACERTDDLAARTMLAIVALAVLPVSISSLWADPAKRPEAAAEVAKADEPQPTAGVVEAQPPASAVEAVAAESAAHRETRGSSDGETVRDQRRGPAGTIGAIA